MDGLGIYAKQLCMALVSEGLAWPHTPFGAGKTEACGYDWSLPCRINAESLALFGALPPSKYDQGQIYDYIFHGFGNGLMKPQFASHWWQEGYDHFFEVTKLGGDLVDYLNQFDLIAGSTWNKNILIRHGLPL